MGRIGKPHGVRGWVTVASTTDEPGRRFAPGAQVLVDDVVRTVVEARLGPRVAIRLDGCDDRAQAETLRGHWMYVEAGDERPEDPDEFYDHQLVGLRVVVAGTAVGTVTDVLHLPAQDLLVVGTGPGQVLVPFVADIVPAVDLATGEVEVVAMEGLFDDAH